MPKKPHSERRRFDRVPILNLDGPRGAQISAISDFKIKIEDQVFEVFDVSYLGAACGLRQAEVNFQVNQKLLAEVRLPKGLSLKCESQVAWVREKSFGLQFLKMELKDRLLLNGFIDDQVIGLHMRAVEPEFFGPGVDFNHWFRGPKDTNIFIWTQKISQSGGPGRSAPREQLVRAQIHLEDQTFSVVVGQESGFYKAPDELNRVLLILGQIQPRPIFVSQLLESLLKPSVGAEG